MSAGSVYQVRIWRIADDVPETHLIRDVCWFSDACARATMGSAIAFAEIERVEIMRWED